MIIFYTGVFIVILMFFLYIIAGIAMFFEPTDNIRDDELPFNTSSKYL